MVDASWRLQSNSGSVTATAGFTATLPNPTQPRSTLLLAVGTALGGTIAAQAQSFDPPWYSDLAVAGKAYLWRRDNQPAGETSWAITTAVSATYAWHVQEWAGLSTVGQPDARSVLTGTPNFITFVNLQVNRIGATTGVPPVPDVADFAGVAVAVGATPGSTAFPAGRSWSSPWSEVTAVTVGTGTSTADVMLMAAEAYPGVSGSLDATLTWDVTGGGDYTNKTVYLGAACYQPAAAPQPSGVLTS
jgi:hypothetical protein